MSITPVAPAPEPPEPDRLGPIGRARASVAAIEILLRLREDQAEPTEEELRALRHWPGWGPLAPALAPGRDGTWAEIGEQLQRLLSPREYRQAEQGTPTAYYTPDRITEACWAALRGLGFEGGRILEPGCGAGTFIKHTPDGLPVQWYGVERDPTTAGIAALLHPDAEIINARLQDASLQSNSVDAVLGNVPYGNYTVFDKTAPKTVTKSIHNYFIWRSVQALRPGGIAILLTSRYTLDAADEAARRAIAEHADLLGAVRLPNGALSEGGTAVLADILVVRRRDTDGPIDESWMGTGMVPGVPDEQCNDYFLANPSHVLGTWERGRAAQYGHTLAVRAPEGQDLSAVLGEAFDAITTRARAAGREWKVNPGAQAWTLDTLPFPVRDDGRKEGSFHLVEGKPHEVIDGELVAVPRAGKELPKLIRLRDATVALIEAETDHDTPDAQLEPLRAEVNRLYDAYVRVHGPINRFTTVQGEVDEETGEAAVSRRYPRLGGFRRDPDVVAVLALEDFDDETRTATKAALQSRRVNKRIERPTSADSPEAALSLCLNFRNRIDIPYIARLLSIEPDQVAGALGDLVFVEPDTGDLLTVGEYLSGPVVDKLERVEFLLSQGREDLQRHVEALREVQPEPLQPEDIKAKLGAPWIPVEDVRAFAEELLGVDVDIVHVAKTATWNVDTPMTVPEAATSEWGTNRADAFELLDLALNGQSPRVYDTFRTPEGGTRRVRNDKATLLAETKLTDLSRRFASWVWEDPERSDRLAADYNRRFNSTVLRKNDGSHLTVDGLDPEFTPYAHQWDFVQRVLSADEGSLCPYPVGAGKTATMFMTALKLKQLGLVNKPMVVVPNHLLEQIARDGKKLFPNANILMAGKKDLADARSRMLFAARCATGDWDTIVMTHSSFGRLGVHPVTEATYLEELANDYREALDALDGDDANQRRIKEIAKQVDRFDARASDLRSKAVDAGVTFENLGVDFLQIDEAHLFKNLALPATTEGMSLGKPSKRATDLDLKILVTRERTGRDNVVALYSGTFISNSVREMYVFKHYTMPKRMEQLGLGTPDAWAANHINFETRPEVGVDGVSFRLKRRPVDYVNADEAIALFNEVAELRPRESFQIERPEREERFVEIEATPNLIRYVEGISGRIDDIQGGKVKPWQDNMLNVITDGRKAALDLELVGMTPDGPGKVGAVVRNVLEIHHQTKNLKFPGDPEDVEGALQLLFCDLGTPGKERGSQVYGKIRRGLIDGLPDEGLPGIPRERIKFIHDYNSDLAKEQLFTNARSGKVNVLFMSSQKGGTGVNVQPRGVALHHVDPPHRPDEWEQREGRLDRPGNKMIKLGKPVTFLRYLALHSFDSYMFQQLERKQKPVVQILSGHRVGRVIEEIDAVGAGFGAAKAIVAGNPLLMELADVNGQLQVLLNAADGHRQAQRRMQSKVEILGQEISQAERDLAPMQVMADAVTAAADDTWRTADGRLVQPDDVPAALAQSAQGARSTLDLSAGYTWRGLNIGFTWHRKQQFGNVAYESYAHLVIPGRHQVDVRLNLPWFGKGQTWRITKALGEAADAAVTAPEELRVKVAKMRTALEDTRPHLGRPFDKHAELEAVRARRAALEAQISDAAVASGRESQSGPQFDPGAAGAEMSEADMAMHDAAVLVATAGGSAVVRSEGQIVGTVRATGPAPADEPFRPHLENPHRFAEALQALTDTALADSDVMRWAQSDADDSAFVGAFGEWTRAWVEQRYGSDAGDRPDWVFAYLDERAYASQDVLHGQAAAAVRQQARALAAPAPDPSRTTTTAADATQPAPASPTPEPASAPQPAAAARRLTDPELWNEGLRTILDGAAGVERLEQAARANDAPNFAIVFADWAEDWLMDRYTDPTAGWPEWARRYFGAGEEAYLDRQQLHAAAATAAYEQLRRTAETPTPAPVPAPVAPEADVASQPEPTLQSLVDGFGGRVMVGHISGPQAARTHQSAGWAIRAVLSEEQMLDLVSAVAVDGQPPSATPDAVPTERVREWIAEQHQAPAAAYYADTSSSLPPALRGNGEVQVSTNGTGLTIAQRDVSTTILWEELPAWIDAAVAHDTATRSPSLPAWAYGRLDAEIHFRRDTETDARAGALDALYVALREGPPPSDEQLAASRDRYGPPPAPAAQDTDTTQTQTDPPAPNAEPEPEPEPLPTEPVPGAEGYTYLETGRTVMLYDSTGEQVGIAQWSYTKYKHLGDVQGDTVRGTAEAAVVAKRMAHHHAVVYGVDVHRPAPDDQGRDPVWILHNGDDTLVVGITPEDATAKAALWTAGGFKQSRKVGGYYLPRTWKVSTRKDRVDTAVRVLAAAGRTVVVYARRDERQQALAAPARLPVLAITPPDFDQVPAFFDAPPYADEAAISQDVDRMSDAYGRWSEHTVVQAYIQQDYDARPSGFGTLDNPIAELRVAYARAEGALRGEASGGADEILRRIHAVAAWSQALEPVVDTELLDPLQRLYAAAHMLGARTQATMAELARQAEQPAPAADSAADQTTPEPQARPEPAAESDPQPAPSDTLVEPAAESSTTAGASPSTAADAGKGASTEPGRDQPPAPAPEVSPVVETAPASADASETGWGFVEGESMRYVGQWDGRYEIALPGATYILFMPSLEHRRTKYSVAQDAPLGQSPKRLRTFEDPDEIVPWLRSHASGQQIGYTFRDGAWAETAAQDDTSPTDQAAEDGQLGLFGAPQDAPGRQQPETNTTAPAVRTSPAPTPTPNTPTAALEAATPATDEALPDTTDSGEEPQTTATPEPVHPPATDGKAEQPDSGPAATDAPGPEPERGPMLTLGLREGAEGQVVARVEAGDTVNVLVLPDISTADVPGLPLPVTVQTPMLVRAARLTEQLVSDEETAAWLGEQLPDGPLADAWSSDRVRPALIVVVRDSLRDSMAPSVDDVAAWLVTAAVENDILLHAAHAGPEAFRAAFALAADPLVTDGASEHLLWTYLGREGRREEVLALATPEARTRLLSRPLPHDPSTTPPVAQTDPDPAQESAMTSPAPAAEEPVREEGDMLVPEKEIVDGDDFGTGETFAIPDDDRHMLFLEGSYGQLSREGQVIATLRQLENGQWYSRMEMDPPDLTPPTDWSETAAEHAATLYAAATGAPLGNPVVPAPGDTAQARAEEVRGDLRVFAAHHMQSITGAVQQLSDAYARNPHYAELATRLAAVADSDGRGSRMMAADLAAVEQAVTDWRAALPPSPSTAIRAGLAFPLAHALVDVWHLQERLQATVAAAAADEQERARREEATAQPETTPAPVAETTQQPPEPAASEPPTQPEPAAQPDLEAPPATTRGPEEEPPAPAEPAPLWGTPDLPVPALDPAQPENKPEPDLLANFTNFQAAWDDVVTDGNSADLLDDVRPHLLTLQSLLADAAQEAPAPPTAPAAAGPESPQERADKVNAAFQHADSQADLLRDLAEWQRIQTVRGALGHLVTTIRQRAGERLDRLLDDQRARGFLRELAAQACDKIAGWAQAAADRLRGGTPHPGTDVLVRLADAAGPYRGSSGPPPSGDGPGDLPDIPAMRKLGEALDKPMPQKPRVSAAAARSRSTTGKRPKKRTPAAEQAGHLRRGTEQSQTRKPPQR
ncbi:hypothetical protein [Streptomyces sp. NPDC097619]|uniref:hypothetical protein n=1 Tax=Streptomyces sp. NPDC097619 TaxID=3157228 RepID=UPI003333F60A